MSAVEPVTVVIADDAEQLRELLSRALEKTGDITVVAKVGDGEAAVDAVRSLEPDVLLLDLSMPVLDGLEVLRSISESKFRTSVVVFSGFGTDHIAETCLRLGASDYLEKGAPMSTVREAILRVARDAQ